MDDFEVLITAAQAWPAFERAVLAAESEIIGGFRIFDMRTKLRSAEARAIGETWFDLLADALERGVSVTLIVSDFDPVMATELHELTWQTKRQAGALAEIARPAPGQLRVIADLHRAEAGLLPWVALLPAVAMKWREKLRQIKGVRRRLQAVRLDPDRLPVLSPVSHHQKIAVIDGKVLYVGGLDLNERRWDTPDHDRPAAHTWSDVQLMIRGPEAEEGRRHLKEMLEVTSGRAQPSQLNRLRRTMSAPRKVQFPFLSPRNVLHEIQDDHLAAFGRAKHLIYVETQFLRSSIIADALAEAGRKTPDLRLVVVLPSLPEEVAFFGNREIDVQFGMARQAEAIARIKDAFGDRATFASPVQPRYAARDTVESSSGSPIVYVHNKLLVQDADFAMVGSANLNGRSMHWDTEAAIRIEDPDRIAALRAALFRHWWFDEIPPEAQDPKTLQQWWGKEIIRNGMRQPVNRTGFLVPHAPDALADLQTDLPGVTEDLV
ncbi:phospholipase D family protein [Marinibacterium profundimaris]|uniref:Phospholipase D n=1 Tax=Marinibacterium profundimaris TaxID=1679460 RepID=A0A225NMV8_9RHOB|nr:phospholipase D family protein [Marinibacterium profundimaris]OWU75712.1 phosphatidylserine synthase [Marinibacterium profundimaris]